VKFLLGHAPGRLLHAKQADGCALRGTVAGATPIRVD
jgi:hypothetical protein